MSTKFEIQQHEISGFGLGGYVQLNGTIKLSGSGRFISEWPEEIRFMGNIYTLEEVIDGAVNPEMGTKWQNAEYV